VNDDPSDPLYNHLCILKIAKRAGTEVNDTNLRTHPSIIERGDISAPGYNNIFVVEEPQAVTVEDAQAVRRGAGASCRRHRAARGDRRCRNEEAAVHRRLAGRSVVPAVESAEPADGGDQVVPESVMLAPAVESNDEPDRGEAVL